MNHFIDFTNINTIDDLYDNLEQIPGYPEFFGRNLDALYDVLVGFLSLPQEFYFIDISAEKIEKFSSVITVFKEAKIELGDEFIFEVHEIQDQKSEDVG